MKKSVVDSSLFQSPKDFLMETYMLEKNGQVTTFLAKPNEGKWVLKNTTIVEGDNMITLINDVGSFKRTMLLKVRRGPREKLQAIVGTSKANLSDFTDGVDSDDVEEKKTAPNVVKSGSATPYRTPAKSAPIKRRATTKMAKTPGANRKQKIGVFEKMIIQKYLEKPATYLKRKFDIRAFMVIMCCKPWIVLGHPGYARVCL
jgi:hypothetical protein